MVAPHIAKNALPESIDARLRETLQDVLGLPSATVSAFTVETELFGALPELDSMAVAALLTEVEDRFSILIDDDDIDGDTFETFGTLLAFIESKIAPLS